MKGSRRFPVLGTGHADCRNFSPRDPGEPAEPLSPVWRPRAPTPSVMGRAEGPAGSHPRPACLLGEGSGDVLTGPAVQVQMDPSGRPIARDGERRAARAAGSGGPGAGRVQPPPAPPPSNTRAPATLPAHTAAPTVVVTASGAGKRVWPHRAAACPHPAGRTDGPGAALWALTSGRTSHVMKAAEGQRRGGDSAPGVGSPRASRPGAGSLRDVTQAARGPDFCCRLA
jgi:hypothetical protein